MSRYVSTPDEQIEDIKKVTIADVRQFYQQFYGGSNGEIVITGQFNKDEAQKLLEQLFGDWKSPAQYTRILGPYRKVDGIERTIETPDKQNAMLIGGMLSKMSDEDPDYPAMVLANYMLGGSTGARLFKRIREKEGLSYSVQSMFSAPTKDDGAQFMALRHRRPAERAESRSQPAGRAHSHAQGRLHTGRSRRRQDRVGRRAARWPVRRTQALAGLLIARARFDRTLKFDEDLEAKVAALTPAQVSEAFRKHVDPSEITWVKAGDFKKAKVYQQ